jgi:hypothetical protein
MSPDKCTAAEQPPGFKNLPPWSSTQKTATMDDIQAKWRICQDFTELNKVTKVSSKPQGDI